MQWHPRALLQGREPHAAACHFDKIEFENVYNWDFECSEIIGKCSHAAGCQIDPIKILKCSDFNLKSGAKMCQFNLCHIFPINSNNEKNVLKC